MARSQSDCAGQLSMEIKDTATGTFGPSRDFWCVPRVKLDRVFPAALLS